MPSKWATSSHTSRTLSPWSHNTQVDRPDMIVTLRPMESMPVLRRAQEANAASTMSWSPLILGEAWWRAMPLWATAVITMSRSAVAGSLAQASANQHLDTASLAISWSPCSSSTAPLNASHCHATSRVTTSRLLRNSWVANRRAVGHVSIALATISRDPFISSVAYCKECPLLPTARSTISGSLRSSSEAYIRPSPSCVTAIFTISRSPRMSSVNHRKDKPWDSAATIMSRSRLSSRESGNSPDIGQTIKRLQKWERKKLVGFFDQKWAKWLWHDASLFTQCVWLTCLTDHFPNYTIFGVGQTPKWHGFRKQRATFRPGFCRQYTGCCSRPVSYKMASKNSQRLQINAVNLSCNVKPLGQRRFQILDARRGWGWWWPVSVCHFHACNLCTCRSACGCVGFCLLVCVCVSTLYGGILFYICKCKTHSSIFLHSYIVFFCRFAFFCSLLFCPFLLLHLSLSIILEAHI